MSVRSADRTLGIFEAFEAELRPMPLSRLAERVGVPISSCHGLVATLLKRGYLYSVAPTKEFYPTRRLLDVAQRIVAHDPFLERIKPLLTEIRDRTQETVIVGKRQGEAVLYLEVVEGLHTVRYTARPGEYKPLHSSAIGKALLGSLAPDALREWMERNGIPRITAHTLTTPEQLYADLAAGRERGYFMTHGENVLDVAAVAIPMRLNNDWLGIAVAGPSHRMAHREAELGARLLDARQRLEREAS